ncbi:MAG: hypothetical protein FVQ79_01675 [Planctomycetes bacterium]|nr:hypothetical protein [Planctomycetota bacterium]
MVSRIEIDVRNTIALLLRQFLQQSKGQRKYLSRVIEEYISQVLFYNESQLSNPIKSILDKFNGFHHWGSATHKPLYTLRELRIIMNLLNEEAPN